MPQGDPFDEQKIRRALAALAGVATPVASAGCEALVLRRPDGGETTIDRQTLEHLARRGLIDRRGAGVVANASGQALLRRIAADGDAFQDQHRDLDVVTVAHADGSAPGRINLAESPLAQLARRKDRDGRPILSAAEISAGERLRADFAHGAMMPRLGANWEAPVASGRRAGSAAELSDSALAARQKVDRALAAVGPELSGVLIDICCFLKGMELVERERGWPVRSAKLMLKAGLGALARHYEPSAGRRRNGMLSWGAPDYRPTIKP